MTKSVSQTDVQAAGVILALWGLFMAFVARPFFVMWAFNYAIFAATGIPGHTPYLAGLFLWLAFSTWVNK